MAKRIELFCTRGFVLPTEIKNQTLEFLNGAETHHSAIF